MTNRDDTQASYSRKYAYKKIQKPLLERKRRARINRCLEELKNLMVKALVVEAQNISKLEKADVLELTVRHLQRIRRTSTPEEEAFRFQAGFSQCAVEAYNFLLNLPGIDANLSQKLVNHLQGVVGPLSIQVPNFRLIFSPPTSPHSRGSRTTISSDVESKFSSRCCEDIKRSHVGLLMVAVQENLGSEKKNHHSQQRTGDCVDGMWRPW